METIPCAYSVDPMVGKFAGVSLRTAWITTEFMVGDREDVLMLWTIFVVLLVLWLLGMVSAYTLGGFIHILLVLAVITLIFNLVSGRRAV